MASAAKQQPDSQWLVAIKALRAHHPRWAELLLRGRLPARPDLEEIPADACCADLLLLDKLRNAVRDNVNFSPFLRWKGKDGDIPDYYGDHYSAKGCHWVLGEGKTFGDLLEQMLKAKSWYKVDGHCCPRPDAPAAHPVASPGETDRYDAESGSSSSDGGIDFDAVPSLEKAARDEQKHKRRALASVELAECDAAIAEAKRRRAEIKEERDRDLRAIEAVAIDEPLTTFRKAFDEALKK